jgi:hypothetical protein
VHVEVLKLLLFGDPLTLNVVREYPNPGAEILLYTNQAINVYYYKYTIGGMNVVLVSIESLLGSMHSERVLCACAC